MRLGEAFKAILRYHLVKYYEVLKNVFIFAPFNHEYPIQSFNSSLSGIQSCLQSMYSSPSVMTHAMQLHFMLVHQQHSNMLTFPPSVLQFQSFSCQLAHISRTCLFQIPENNYLQTSRQFCSPSNINHSSLLQRKAKDNCITSQETPFLHVSEICFHPLLPIPSPGGNFGALFLYKMVNSYQEIVVFT